jgi:hypothetical protein
MKLHPVDFGVKCLQCLLGPLEFAGVLRIGDKYRCTRCNSAIMHYRRKGTMRCGLAPVLGFGRLGTWQEHGCEPARVDVAV